MLRAKPNNGHFALAKAQQSGRVVKVITQNVDNLHEQAGSDDVLHLHGNIHDVSCLSCGATLSRVEVQQELESNNPHYLARMRAYFEATPFQPDQAIPLHLQSSAHAHLRGDLTPYRYRADRPRAFHDAPSTDPTEAPTEAQLRPDGDINIDAPEAFADFVLPTCRSCKTGILKPQVVFFGGSIESSVSAEAEKWMEKCSALVVVGTSLVTWSSYKLVRHALSRVPVVWKPAYEQHNNLMNNGNTTAGLYSPPPHIHRSHLPACPIAIINAGNTRIDPLLPDAAPYMRKFEGRAGDILHSVFG